MTALNPFVIAYRLPLNPEDLEEMVYAVLKHAAGLEPLDQITETVNKQIASEGRQPQTIRTLRRHSKITGNRRHWVTGSGRRADDVHMSRPGFGGGWVIPRFQGCGS